MNLLENIMRIKENHGTWVEPSFGINHGVSLIETKFCIDFCRFMFQEERKLEIKGVSNITPFLLFRYFLKSDILLRNFYIPAISSGTLNDVFYFCNYPGVYFVSQFREETEHSLRCFLNDKQKVILDEVMAYCSIVRNCIFRIHSLEELEKCISFLKS